LKILRVPIGASALDRTANKMLFETLVSADFVRGIFVFLSDCTEVLENIKMKENRLFVVLLFL
jgi:hypothetical protein